MSRGQTQSIERVPQMFEHRLDESEHNEALVEASMALERANSTAEGYPFDTEARQHLRKSLHHLRQARKLYRAHQARVLIGDIQQRQIDRREE